MSTQLRGRSSAAVAVAPSSASLPLASSKNPQSPRRNQEAKHIRDAQLRLSRRSLKFRLTAAIFSAIITFHVAKWTLDQVFYTYGSKDIPVINTEVKFSVVINTFKRPDMLKEAVQHYAQRCGPRTGVAAVFIIWADQEVSPPEVASFFEPRPTILRRIKPASTLQNISHVEVIKVADSLNSRFHPIPQMTTTALFMVDDDVQVDCQSLATGFEAWKSYPDSMVGYYPRLASAPRGHVAATHGYIEHCWPIVFLTQRVNFLLTKASFLHSRYLELYSSTSGSHPQEIKDYVDKYKNCEDVAMSLLVANITRYESQDHRPAMPIYVEGSVSDQGLFNGISMGPGFVDRRANCLTDLSRMYTSRWPDSRPPLEYTFSLKEVSWARHFPGFWWLYRPSNPFEWGALLDFFQ
jgi:hypothetical protein